MWTMVAPRWVVSYLVETYRPGGGGALLLGAVEAAVGEAVTQLRREGSLIEFKGGVEIPGDETTFLLFEAASIEVVEDAMRRAGMVAERVVEAVASEFMGTSVRRQAMKEKRP